MGSAVATALSNWVDGVEAASALAMVVIAGLALRTWRKQDKAQREAGFIDDLVEAAHTYISQMPVAITLADISKIGMRGYSNGPEATVEGAIAWIEQDGKRQSKQLMDALAAVQPSLVRLRSLVIKGQVFKLEDYAICKDTVAILGWQFDRLQALAVAIGSPNWNWQNPEILEHLQKVLKIDAREIGECLQSGNVAIIEFSRKTYKRLYG